jgi:SAM-dependent MidA family methyltransferase
LVEMGSGDGRLLEQIITELQSQQIAPSDVCVYSIERSPYHRALQKDRLKFNSYPLHWVEDFAQIPTASFAIVYSNELVDAFPVHRCKRERGVWQEIYVTEQTGELVEMLGELSSAKLHTYCEQIEDDIAEGQQMEVNLAAHTWLQEITEWLETGYLLTADYGGTSQELRSVRYLDGTMRYYRAHQHVNNPYLQLGEVDMTAHVNFDDLRFWGKAFGLSTDFYGSQAKFLIEAGILEFTDPHYRNAIKQLLIGMGENFQILVQQK